jgi:RHS repeat-associated protein
VSQLLSQAHLVLSSIKQRLSSRRLYAPGLALFTISLLGAATFGNLSEARGAIRHYAANARAALFAASGDTVVVFGPKQFTTLKAKTQINFAESFSVPPSSTPNATEYTIRLQRVGSALSLATVKINGVQVAVLADFGTATTIERVVTVNQADPNTNTLTLSLKSNAAGAGIIATIFGAPNTSFDVFGPKSYTRTSTTAIFLDSFVLPAGAAPPYRIIATPSATTAKAYIFLNGVKVIAGAEFGTLASIERTVTLVSGTNSLKIDHRGTVGTSVTIRITAKGSSKPVITITAPQPNLVTNAATLSVTGSVQDIVPATVKVNGIAATMSGAGNSQFAATIPLTEGSNTVLISATNQFNNRTDSTRTVIRDSQAPSLAFTSPADGSYTNQAAATVLGTVGGGGTITVKVNGVSFPVGSGTFTGSYQLTAGSNFLTAVATDQAGNSASVTNKVTLDTEAPVVTIAAPAEGLITKETSVAVSGTVTDASPTTVTVNGVSTPVGSDGGFAVTILLGTEGSNAISVVATDAASNQSTASRNVIRDSQAPVVTIASPAEGFITKQSTVSVSGSVTDATPVTLTANGVALTVDASGNFTGEVPLAAEGANAMAFVATDAATNQSAESRNVVRDTQAPVITLSSPAEGLVTKETSVEVVGTVTDASPTTVTVNGVNVPVGENGSFTATVLVNEGANAITVVAADGATNESTASRNVVRDSQAPVVTIAAPAEGFVTNTNSISVSGTVADASPVTLSVNGVTIAVDASGNFAGAVPLGAEGPNTITFTATDAAGNSAAPAVSVRRDSEAPVLNVTSPTDNSITKTNTASIAGNVYDASSVAVSVNGSPMIVDGTGNLSGSVTLAEGQNIITVVATDGAGNTASQVRRVTLDTEAPVITISTPSNGASVVTPSVTTTGSVTDATTTTLSVNGAPFTLGAGGAFSGDVALTTGQNTLSYVATDAAGNIGTASRNVTRALPGTPDPVAVATPVNQAEVTLMQENTAFLYAGANPVQTGVAPGTIAFLRSAVLRGRVLDRTLTPLGDVAVSIKDHPELGRTTTRSDGRYDLAVNGGGTLLLDFAKSTYLPAQRGVAVPWQDYTIVDDVVLLQPDAAVTTVDLTSSEITVAQGSVQTDADGPRHATVFFEPGTQATLRRVDGTTQVLTSLDIRATEFTVGANGAKAMPGQLPPSSQYTYAMQVTADQQLAAGPGATLTFSQPVPLYVENFLGFPVGTAVPTGVYSPSAGLWQPRPNGVVLKILGKDAQNRAILDINGDGVADSDSLLVFNGIDPLERIKLAGTYPAGSALWRVYIIEALPHDLNWPYVILGGDAPRIKVTGPCGSEGADVMRCSLQVQTAFQSVGIVGSPFTLNYASDRTRGNVSDRQLKIQLVGATVPSSLERVDMEIDIVGRRFEASFIPTPNLSYTFVWDGKDAYGRTVQATQPLSARISYMYPVVYGKPAPVQQSFALPCQLTVGGCQLPSETLGESIRALRRVAQTITTTLGAFDATGAGLGGFTLNVQHSYDPIGGQFYAGDGTRRVAATLPEQVTRWAGTGQFGNQTVIPIQDNVPKTQSMVSDPQGIVVAPDGSVFIADSYRGRIRKVSPDGIITTVAGGVVLNGSETGYNGDNRLATTAQLSEPRALALGPDGSLYIAESSVGTQRQAIRRIGPDGFIRAVAGDGTCGFTGDNGAATLARVCGVMGLGIAPDGSLYFSDSRNHRIRRIGPDGIIRTVAGGTGFCARVGNSGQIAPAGDYEKTPAQGGCGEGIPATGAVLLSPTGLAVGADGTVYFAQPHAGIYAGRIRRIDPAGFIYTVAGADVALDKLNEGGPAKETQLGDLTASGIAVALDGSVYFSSRNNVGRFPVLYERVRRVHPDGRITTVLGDGIIRTFGTFGTVVGDDGPARRARIAWVSGLALTQAGDLLVSDNAEVRLVSPPLPGLAGGQTVIASADGSELYVFSSAGRILLTLSGLTRDTLYKFNYDTNRRLASIADSHGQVTRIVRDGAGAVSAVVAPTGEQSAIGGVGGGDVSVTGPDGIPVRFVLNSVGLLQGVRDKRGELTEFAYDDTGRLTQLTSPTGRVGSRITADATTTFTMPSGQTSAVSTTNPIAGGTEIAGKAGSFTTTGTVGADGSSKSAGPDGTVTTSVALADPVFGIQAPLQDVSVRLPSGLTASVLNRAAVVRDPLTGEITRRTDSTVINGRARVTTTEFPTHTSTVSTAAGRRAIINVDSNGQITRDSVPGMLATRRVYDSTGRVTSVVRGGQVWLFGYDSFGRVSRVTSPDGHVERNVLDNAGRPTLTISANRDTTAYEYDENGAMTALKPNGRPAHRFTYTDDGLVETYQPPSVAGGGGPTRIVHDPDQRVAMIIRPAGDTIAMTYDALGRRTEMRSSQGRYTYTYDATTGGLNQLVTPGADTVALVYDGALLTQTRWKGSVSGLVQVGYDNDFRPASLTVNGSNIAFLYDADGLVRQAGALTVTRNMTNTSIAATAIGGVSTSTAYDSLARPNKFAAVFNGDTIYSAGYSHDLIGRVTGVVESSVGLTLARGFLYDSAGQLAQVTQNGLQIASYEYDAAGNRVRVVRPSGVEIGVLDAQDRVTQYGSAAYTYTPAGELASKVVGSETTRYHYGASGELLAVDLPEGTHIDYIHDAAHRRIGKRVDGALTSAFLYYGGSVVAELDGVGQIRSRFVYGTRRDVPDYMEREGHTYRFVSDHLGSVRLVVDVGTGEIAQALQYDEFGRVLADSRPGFQPFGYGGGLYDHQTGLVRFGSRDYDAHTGRWTSKDPLLFEGGDVNLYRYVDNDPVSRTDPTGLCDASCTLVGSAMTTAMIGTMVTNQMLGRGLMENVMRNVALTGIAAYTAVVAIPYMITTATSWGFASGVGGSATTVIIGREAATAQHIGRVGEVVLDIPEGVVKALSYLGPEAFRLLNAGWLAYWVQIMGARVQAVSPIVGNQLRDGGTALTGYAYELMWLTQWGKLGAVTFSP